MKRTAFKSSIHSLLLAVLFLALLPGGTARAAGRCYVKKSAGGANSGASWTNAYLSLQTALEASCTEIWVAKGTYNPGTVPGDTFQLKNGVAIYGGFAGNEVSGFNLDSRNFSTNETILSGDIDNNDTFVSLIYTVNGNNSYHVVTGTASEGSSAILDGFTITGGKIYFNEITNNVPITSGGGLYNNGGSPTLRNLTFENNRVLFGTCYGICGGFGGGMYNEGGSPTLTNVTFKDNTAYNGGGMANQGGSPTLANVTFSGNQAEKFGGGMYNAGGSPKLTNVTFKDNISGGGGGMYIESGTPTLTNVTFSGNITIGPGGGMYNESGSPTLTNVTFSGNTATGHLIGYGGGMLNLSGFPTLTNVTFHKNKAYGGGGMVDPSCESVISNTIFWDNEGTASYPEIYYNPIKPPHISDSVVKGGYAPGTNIITTDPKLGTLGDHGGSTQTIPIQAGSSAIDMGDATKCPTKDQRGVARLGRCDIGAYEYSPVVRIIVHPWVIIASDGLYPERVRVDWTASTGASYYLVYRSESLDGPKLPTEGVRTTSPGGDDLWALPGVTYYYWVKACTDSGCGEFYTYNYDTGWRGLAAPVITASDGLFSDKVQVSWPAVTGASSYLGYRAESLAGTQIPVNGYLTSFPGGDDLWALPGVTYFYWVKACNGLNCSPLSAVDTGWR